MIRLLLPLAVLLAMLAWPAGAAAQAAPPDRATYAGWVREAFAAAQRRDRLGLEEVAERLVATSAVQVGDDVTVPVDNRWLAAALESRDPDFDMIAARLGALLDALALPDSSAPPDALGRLRQILNRPPYRTEPDPAADQRMTWFDGFFEWLGRLIDGLLSPARSLPTGAGQTVAWVVGGVSLLLLLAVIAYTLLGLRRAVVREAQRPEADPEANLTARSALDQAGDLARDGDYRTAVRYLYLSALLWLDERGMLRYDRALTNREYLDFLRDDPALCERLAPIVETFDRVWYGHAPLDAEMFAAYREHVEALRKHP